MSVWEPVVRTDDALPGFLAFATGIHFVHSKVSRSTVPLRHAHCLTAHLFAEAYFTVVYSPPRKSMRTPSEY